MTKINDLNLEDYQKEHTEKLDAVGAGVNLERKHKEFLKNYSVNLSALVRDVIDKLMAKKEEELKNEKKNT